MTDYYVPDHAMAAGFAAEDAEARDDAVQARVAALLADPEYLAACVAEEPDIVSAHADAIAALLIDNGTGTTGWPLLYALAEADLRTPA